MGGLVRACPSVCKPLILLKCQQAKHWNLTSSRKAAVQQIWSPCGYEQAKKEFPCGINKAPHYCSAYSFVCLLNVFARLLPFPSFPHSVIHSFFSRHVTKNAVTTSRFTWFDWAGHAQSILVEVCEKLSNITLALTKRCECPDRGNDTGHIRLNDNQHSSSPFIPAWHWITWVCGQACICVWSVCLISKEWEKEAGKKRGKRRRSGFDREQRK